MITIGALAMALMTVLSMCLGSRTANASMRSTPAASSLLLAGSNASAPRLLIALTTRIALRGSLSSIPALCAGAAFIPQGQRLVRWSHEPAKLPSDPDAPLPFVGVDARHG